MPQVFFGIRVDGTNRAAGKVGPWSPTGFENAIKFWLTRIFATDTGKALLEEIAPAQRLLIEPDQNKPQTPGTGPEANDDWDAWRAGIRRGVTARHGRGGLIGGVGTGEGTPVSIKFTPADWVGSPPEEQPDMVLIHEMAHATRFLAGIVTNTPMQSFGFLTREEVHAILIANMYRSERDLKRFRIQHRPARYAGIDAARQTFRLGKHLLRRMAQGQESFYQRLAEIETPFNPLRELLPKVRSAG